MLSQKSSAMKKKVAEYSYIFHDQNSLTVIKETGQTSDLTLYNKMSFCYWFKYTGQIL